MQSSNDTDSREIIAKACLILVAAGLNALEFFIPRIPFLPWIKPGLANIVTIIWIVRWGSLDALLFTLVRIWIVGFYVGFSFVALALATSGGVFATLVMGGLWALLGKRKWMGLVGMGILGALAHNAGQLAAVYVLLAHDVHIWLQTPMILAASLIFGGFTGWMASICYQQTQAGENASAVPMGITIPNHAPPASAAHKVIAIAVFSACIGIMFVQQIWILAGCAVIATAISFIVKRFIFAPLVYPAKRFWLLFVLIAAVYLVFSYGRRVPGFSIITYEGARETALQWLKLWTWLELSLLLSHFKFNQVFFSLLSALFPGFRNTLSAGMVALEQVPRVMETTREHRIFELRMFKQAPARLVSNIFSRLHALVSKEMGNA
jgi:heptaprenyl diphosphate synthase